MTSTGIEKKANTKHSAPHVDSASPSHTNGTSEETSSISSPMNELMECGSPLPAHLGGIATNSFACLGTSNLASRESSADAAANELMNHLETPAGDSAGDSADGLLVSQHAVPASQFRSSLTARLATEIPTISSAYTRTQKAYNYVKEKNAYIKSGLISAEEKGNALVHAVAKNENFQPTLHRLHVYGHQGLDILEKNLPLVKQHPHEIYEAAARRISEINLPGSQTLRLIANKTKSIGSNFNQSVSAARESGLYTQTAQALSQIQMKSHEIAEFLRGYALQLMNHESITDKAALLKDISAKTQFAVSELEASVIARIQFIQDFIRHFQQQTAHMVQGAQTKLDNLRKSTHERAFFVYSFAKESIDAQIVTKELKRFINLLKEYSAEHSPKYASFEKEASRRFNHLSSQLSEAWNAFLYSSAAYLEYIPFIRQFSTVKEGAMAYRTCP